MRICHWIVTVIILVMLLSSRVEAITKVDLIKTPNDGIQPRVKVDTSGQVHLIYYKGDQQAGDLFYSRKARNGQFTAPIRVNSISNSAISMGTIRGAQLAIDPSGNIHVVWNGSWKTKPESLGGPVMNYARLEANAKAFGPQRSISGKWSVDGGGAIAADNQGNIFVFWHSVSKGAGEKNRKVFVAISSDQGQHFDKEHAISPPLGVCGCCAMQAEGDSEGNVYVVYRTATNNETRDINLLLSKNRGKTFESKILEKWPVNTCPMSSMSLFELSNRMLIGWETNKQVRFTTIAKGTVDTETIVSLGGMAMGGKHPVFAASSDEKVLIAWTEGTGWGKGGGVAWQEFSSLIRPVSMIDRLPEAVSVWSFVASYYDRDTKTFYVVY